MQMRVWILAAFLLSIFTFSSGKVVYFRNDVLVALPSVVFVARSGMYSNSDAPPLSSTEYESKIKFDLVVEDAPAVIEAILFHSEDAHLVGYQLEGQTHLCRNGSAVVQLNDNDRSIRMRSFSTPGHFTWSYSVTKSGVYTVLLAKCEMSAAPVKLFGLISFENPFGLLDGELYGNLPFFAFLTMVYVGSSIVWAVFNVINWRDLVKLQLYITGVLFLSMLETMFLYFKYYDINESGNESPSLMSFTIVLTLARKTVSRLLVLVVSMGYGVVKPTLGETAYKVVAYGWVYFITSCLFEIGQALFRLNVISLSFSALFNFPVAAADAVLLFWVISSMNRTMSQLAVRKQVAKLSLYSRFRATLGFYATVTVIWIIYEFYYGVSNSFDTQWESYWALNAFWHSLHVFVLLIIMFLWRPTANNIRYAYGEDLTTDDDIDLPEPGGRRRLREVREANEEGEGDQDVLLGGGSRGISSASTAIRHGEAHTAPLASTTSSTAAATTTNNTVASIGISAENKARTSMTGFEFDADGAEDEEEQKTD